MKKLIATIILAIGSLNCSAQNNTAPPTGVLTSPNLVGVCSAGQTPSTTGTCAPTWAGTVAYTGTGGGYSGGSTPAYNSTNNTIYFGYNQSTAAYTYALSNALQNSGMTIAGYNYSWQYYNQGTSAGILTAKVNFTSNNGTSLSSKSWTLGTTTDWTTLAGTETFPNGGLAVSNIANFSLSFNGKDNRYWAGYYGPQVRNPTLSLNYTIDPCSNNPAYSPTCANFNTVQKSDNLVPNPNGYAVLGNSIDNSYGINKALALSGSGVMIHGFEWGYVANANGPTATTTPSVTTNVSITDNNNNNLYSISRTYTNSYNTTDYRYLFPSSRNLTTLGRFNFTAETNDVAYVGSMWSKALYTPDPCTVNPLSSTSCSGYQQAYLDQQCTANPLYSTSCSGYQQAYLDQQCTANPLYSPSCSGYTQAYHDQQCSVNALYASDCPGYAQAYHDQQCAANPLYATDCPGYAVAYKKQQCSLNPLYASDCPGYETAYKNQQCSLNPLYASDCPGYETAYKSQQCSINALYASDCPGYSVAYKNQQCSLNPLYASDCPGYGRAYFNQQCSLNPLYDANCTGYSQAYHDQQCAANPLYATDCPGYGRAYFNQQCSLNALYATDCPGYAVAYKNQQCNLNTLYSSDCPGYATAYKNQQCSINALYAIDCPGYAAAYKNQQCSLNSLYATDCPGYAQAYFNQQCLKDSLYDKKCEGYATAYAIKYLTPTLDPVVTTTVNSQLTTNVEIVKSDPAKVTVVSPTVDSVLTPPSSTTATSITSVNSVILPPPPRPGTMMANATASTPPPPPPTAKQEEKSQEQKKSDNEVAKVEKKSGGDAQTARKEIAAKAVEIAKAASKSATMEAQVAQQGILVGLMGYVPGFSAYHTTIQDTNGLEMARKYTKPVVDNISIQRRMSGANETRWKEIVDSQYQIGEK